MKPILAAFLLGGPELLILLMAAVLGMSLLIVAVVFTVWRSRRGKQTSLPLHQPPSPPPPIMPATVEFPKCPQCQQPQPENAPEGLCPACLAKVALETEPATSGGTININPMGEAAPGTRVPPDPAQLAAQFPQLEIIELLGAGGMGMVYKARQPRLDRFVALKILPVESAAHPSFAERFNREAKALAKLNHPGIVDVYDFGQTGQYYYFVMEYVDGMNLRRLLNTQTVTPRQALELVVQICTALQYAHDEGVVHRDIKPENILINKKGQVKIADFGLAKLLGTAPDTALTMSQAAMGTFNYMAPEQRQNAQGVDHRADIYSLGVVFYEMLTGEVPMGRFEPPSKRVQVDVRLDEVVLRALEREPARRYQHVSEVKTGVETIGSTMSRGSTAAGAPEAFKPQPPESMLRGRLPISGYELGIGVATLSLLGLLSWGAAFCFRSDSYGSAAVVLVAELGIVLAVTQSLHSRVAVRRAREKGLWPQFGEIPAVEHVKRLAQSGERSLAIKLYRQICPVSLRDAKEVVEGLAARSSGGPSPGGAAAPPAAAPPATPDSSQPRLSRTAFVGAVWAPWFFLAALSPGLTKFLSGPAHWRVVLIIALFLTGAMAPFGTTILGYVALSQIRHSAGRLYGLGLALFDALIFPLLVLDGVVVVFLACMVGFSKSMAGFYEGVGLLLSVVLDYFVIRRAWRFCRSIK
jgi:predicted Ser/Thr protein kinase